MGIYGVVGYLGAGFYAVSETLEKCFNHFNIFSL